MIKGNILKPSTYVLFSIAVIVVFILLLRQCSGDESTRETSIESSLQKNNDKRDVAENGKKKELNKKTHSVENKEEVGLVQSGVDEKEVKLNATKKLGTSNLQMKKPDYPFGHKKSKTNISTQFDKGIGEGKPKAEEILKNDLKVLTEKVNVLEGKVNALLEKMRLFSEEKGNRILAKELVKKDTNVNLTSTMDTLKNDDGLIYKYPTHVVAGGLSSYEKWTGYGFQASYAYRVNKFVSLGVQGNAFLKEGKYNGDRDFGMSFRANFHIFPLFVENSKFDIYASGTAGVGRDDDVETFETIWYIGSSYDFNKYWGVFAEGGNIGVIGLRLAF